jgi:hypothetical protein
MINKFYKRVHSRYSNFFKFFFFLRHIFIIFFLSSFLFLLIPKFFDYEKKQEIIKVYLLEKYALRINNYDSIKFKIFPLPNLYITDVNLKIKDYSINLNSKNISIFLKLKNIYDYKNFNANKIILEESKIDLKDNKIKEFINFLNQLKYKIDIKNLDLNIKKDNKKLIAVKNITFSNYGYKKYHIRGNVFGKKFKAILKNNNQNLNFKILNTGIKANFEFDENNTVNSVLGLSRISLLNNFLKFNFNFDNNQLEVIKSNFRNKDISFSLDSIIKFNPFFNVISNIDIKEINEDLFEKFYFEQILTNKEIIKKLNGKININFKNKRYFVDLIESYYGNLNLAYGRLIFSNKILIIGGAVSCSGESIIAEEYPKLNFSCYFSSSDKKKLFKKFSIQKDIDQNSLNLNVSGSINLLSKKIKFKKINIDKKFIANKEDLKYFEDKFDSILFKDGFFKVFKREKIKEFILEII